MRIQSPWLSTAVQVGWAWQSLCHSVRPEYDLKAPFHENKDHCSCLLRMALLLPAGNIFVLCLQLGTWFCFRSTFDSGVYRKQRPECPSLTDLPGKSIPTSYAMFDLLRLPFSPPHPEGFIFTQASCQFPSLRTISPKTQSRQHYSTGKCLWKILQCFFTSEKIAVEGGYILGQSF